jgi:hypothetical protein
VCFHLFEGDRDRFGESTRHFHPHLAEIFHAYGCDAILHDSSFLLPLWYKVFKRII